MKTGLRARIGVRLLVFALVLVVIGCLALVSGIKSDADRLRAAEVRLSSLDTSCMYCSGGGHAPELINKYRAEVTQAKAALTGPRRAICQVLWLCHGLDI